MASKSWPTTNVVQCGSSSKQLGRHTDPIIYHLQSKKTCKRNSEETLESAGKRRRTSHCNSTGETACLPGPSTAAVLVTKDKKTSCKRKSTSDESAEGQKKRSRGSPSPSEEQKETFRDPSPSSEDAGTSTPASVAISPESSETKKRKSEETVGSRKKSRRTPSPSEGPSQQASTEPSTSDQPGTSSSLDTAPPHSRATFEAKYKERQLLGRGGYGSVFAGYRIDDYLPVAIKHIPQSSNQRISVILDGKTRTLPREVALLLKLKPAAPKTSAVVALLDWYDLDQELILVLERPVPCMDLINYVFSRETFLEEHEAKILTKQLVDALIEVHSKGVFHRDIKMDNILIETSSDVPRVRLIDFGCGAILSEGRYISGQGTYEYSSPEWFLRGWYMAGPTTVWQLGVVLFAILHRQLPFSDSSEIIKAKPNIRDSLSPGCQAFLRRCLTKRPEIRATLRTLKEHPWLRR